MSFTLNQVTRRAGGGEIVRTRLFETAEISIGRGSDCDIQLPDLAVSLRHAVMRQTAPNEVAIEAAGREPFEIDGKFATQARVTTAAEHHLILGSHNLVLKAGETPGDIAITVTRSETAPTAAAEDEEKIFSIQESILGKRAMAWTFGLLIVVLCLAFPIGGFLIHQNARIHADQQWSGGPLSHAHAFLGKNCQTCHVKAFVAVRDDACLACHRVGKDRAEKDHIAALNRRWGGPVAANTVENHADPHRLLTATPLPPDFGGKMQAVFRRAFNHPSDRCASCHLEHIDAKGPPKTAGGPPTPAPAIPTLVTVNRCADCHGKLKERLADTRLIDTPDWGRHPDFRPRIVTALEPAPQFERVSIAGQPLEANGLTFSHRIHLNPTGGAARMAQVLGPLQGYGGPLDCAGCHRPDPSGKGFFPVEMQRDCSACHSLAYARIGGELKMLPHGRPDQVVAALRGFYAGGGRTAAAASDNSRRLPGFMEDVRRAMGGRPAESADVVAGVRQVFAPGGVCAECHTVLRPADPNSLNYGIALVYLNQHYLPWGDFDHGVPQHAKDAQGRPSCGSCHNARQTDDAREVMLPRISACAECHGKSRKQSVASASADCTECHSYHAPGEATPKGAGEHVAMLTQPASGAGGQTTP